MLHVSTSESRGTELVLSLFFTFIPTFILTFILTSKISIYHNKTIAAGVPQSRPFDDKARVNVACLRTIQRATRFLTLNSDRSYLRPFTPKKRDIPFSSMYSYIVFANASNGQFIEISCIA